MCVNMGENMGINMCVNMYVNMCVRMCVNKCVTGQESQERADCLSVVKYLVMWLICSQLSDQPSNQLLQPPYPTY